MHPFHQSARSVQLGQPRHSHLCLQWARLDPWLPSNGPRRGRRWSDHRRVVNVVWRTRTGSPCQDLPPVHGPWKTAYNRHRRWSADGTWERVLSARRGVADGDAGEGEWMVGVDSTVVRAHQHAAGLGANCPVSTASQGAVSNGNNLETGQNSRNARHRAAPAAG